MSRHRGAPEPRYQTRYGRVAVLGLSLVTTAVALLGGVGVLPSAAGDRAPDVVVAVDANVAALVEPEASSEAEEADEPAAVTPEVVDEPVREESAAALESVEPASSTVPVLPTDSGDGKRVVFSESEQRVWFVGDFGKIKRTYLVSGSLTDNLDPGTYQVYSRSEDAIGIDDSGTMKWFVRFTQGPTGAAIGFHTIPVDDGERVQSNSDLGTPQSHGCIRQKTVDAEALWEFAPLGTTVVVV